MSANIEQLGYLAFGVSDMGGWESFMTKTLGLELIGPRDDGAMAFRMDDYGYRFLIYPDDRDDLLFLGWQAKDCATVQSVAEVVRKSGIEVRRASDQDLKARQVEEMIQFQDPSGNAVEIFCGAKMGETPFKSKVIHSNFVAGEMGLGHLVLSVSDRDQLRDFYIDVLGFRLSDYIICDIGSFHVDIVFLHINNRHHSLALGGPMRKRMHHFMLQVESIDDVGLTYDRVRDHGVRVDMDLGRHPNDRMFSFYAQTPSGFQFEFGWGGAEVDDSLWQPTIHHKISEWGHRPPPR